ncbi:MAG: hypothetical protein KC502_19875 [Myxococcales bacterium]|nr:hypothetical protein [Myxococcales bacterium]
MRKYIPRGLLLLVMVMMTVGCGSDGGETTKTDAGTSTDGASEDGSIGADAAGVDGAASGDGQSSDAAASDAGQSAKYTTCSAVADCVDKACEKAEEGCEKTCLADGSKEALLGAAPLLSCYSSKCLEGACKDSDDDDCENDCMTEQCTAEFFTCIDTPATGKGLCGSSFDCFDKCDESKEGRFACYTTCIDSLSKDDTKLLEAVGTCMAANPGKNPEKVCGNEMFGCMLGSKTGDKGCHTIFSCSAACEKKDGKDANCMGKCAGDLTKDAQKAFIALGPCLGSKDMDTDPKCQAALKTCIGPSGKATCQDTFGCASKCPEGDDPSCMFDCLHQTDEAGYAAFSKIAACNGNGGGATTPPGGVTATDAPGGATPTDDDMSPECISAMISCAAPSGTGDCAAVGKCVFGCMDKSKEDNPMSCIFQCASSGTAKAFGELAAFAQCDDKCEDKCKGKGDSCTNQCMQTDCPGPLKACSQT